jgi:hypothetical protein
MVTFAISEDNNITAYPSAEEARAEAGSITFDSQAALAEASAEWPASRLVEIWNSIPGNTPVKKFENRKKALGRIWKGIQGLAGAAKPQIAQSAKPLKTPKKAKPATKSAPKKQAKDSGDRTNKKAEVIAMMKRAKGATLPEIMEATGWQAHTVRGFVSILGSKGGQTIESLKDASGERRYKIAK